jgi:hypothetical protein
MNNLFSILIFLIEEYIGDKQDMMVIDLVIIGLYLIEFIYNLVTFPPPKCGFFTLYFTWVDILTMITPVINIILNVYVADTSFAYIKIVRFLRISKVIRILRLIKVIKRYTVL